MTKATRFWRRALIGGALGVIAVPGAALALQAAGVLELAESIVAWLLVLSGAFMLVPARHRLRERANATRPAESDAVPS